MKKHVILSMVVFCASASILNTFVEGYVDNKLLFKTSVSLIILSLLWVPIVILYQKLKK